MAVPAIMFSWPLVVILLFAQLPPRRAVIWSMLTAWLFLPIADLKVVGIPDYSKMTATSYGLILGIVLFDFESLFTFHWSWIDAPVAIWCLCPAVSSIANGLGPYDAASAAVYQTITWGIPYFVGRLYFSDKETVMELAHALVVGGLIYVPLCLFEIRMSPQLHKVVYGYQQSFGQEFRYGGYRPPVFMQHGLMVGMWMCMTALIAWWLWWNNRLPTILGVPAWVQVALLVVTAVLCKSTGAIALLAAGVGALGVTKVLNTRLGMVLLVSAAPLYIVLRCTGSWDGQGIVSLADEELDSDRAGSFDFRLQNENILMNKALQQPVFGWGGWGRSRVYDENGKDISTTDGLWIIALGCNGIVGLTALTVFLLLPGTLLILRYSPADWSRPDIAALAVCSVVTTLYMIDNIPNGMVNPIFAMVAGAICGGFALSRAAHARDRIEAPPPSRAGTYLATHPRTTGSP